MEAQSGFTKDNKNIKGGLKGSRYQIFQPFVCKERLKLEQK